MSLEQLSIAGGPPQSEVFQIETRGHEELAIRLRNARTSGGGLAPLMDQLWEWSQEGWRVVLSAPALSGVERLRTLLREYGLDPEISSTLMLYAIGGGVLGDLGEFSSSLASLICQHAAGASESTPEAAALATAQRSH